MASHSAADSQRAALVGSAKDEVRHSLESHSASSVPILAFRERINEGETASTLALIILLQGVGPLILLNSQGIPGAQILGARGGAARESSVEAANRWGRALVPPAVAPGHAFLAAPLTTDTHGVINVNVMPRIDLAAHDVVQFLGGEIITSSEGFSSFIASDTKRWAACSFEAVKGSGVENMCSIAIMAVDRLIHRPSSGTPQTVAEAHGTSTRQTQVATSTTNEYWGLQRRLHEHAQSAVRAALNAAGSATDEYVDRVSGQTFDDTPTSLRSPDPEAWAQAWATEPFSAVIDPPTTTPLPPVTPQPRSLWKPRRIQDLLTPGAFAAITAWLRKNAQDMADMHRSGETTTRPHKPRPLVLAQSDFVPEARGVVWDLRRADQGIIEPLDFEASPQSSLNVPLLEQLLSECPDRELIDHIKFGVDFKADLELQAVLLPHMASLAPHAQLVEDELVRLVERQWHELFAGVPFLPCRLNPNGAVVRKLEQLRPRRVENASADGSSKHGPLVDADGIEVTSLNAAVGIHDDAEHSSTSETAHDPKWPRERKPTVLNKVHDLAVLRFASRVFDQELVGFVTDFKDYFSHFAVRAKYLWANIVHWRSILGIGGEDLGCFVSELRLGFGVSASSNVCQRFAHALASIFRAAFDREEEEILARETDPKRRAYLEGRRRLGKGQARLYELSIYTDDPFFACIGADRLTRALKLWHRITGEVGMELAIPAKRQCGAELHWLGIEFILTAGVHFVRPNKRLRALHQLLPIAAGTPTQFADYRSVTSFLQYLRPLVQHMDPSDMYGIYGPYGRGKDGSLPSPSTIVVAGEQAQARLMKWIEVLRTSCGAHFSATLTARPPPAEGIEFIALHSDAAAEADAQSGLGGFCVGFYWHMALEGDATRLPISVLEFLAIGINLIIFSFLLGSAWPLVVSDSLNSIQVLHNFSADSELMQVTHSIILKLPEYTRIVDRSKAIHCFGPANPCADAASRGRFEIIIQICSQLGIVPTKLEVPPRAHTMVQEVLGHATRNGLLTSGPRRHIHSTSVALGAALQAANGFGHRGTLAAEYRGRPERWAASSLTETTHEDTTEHRPHLTHNQETRKRKERLATTSAPTSTEPRERTLASSGWAHGTEEQAQGTEDAHRLKRACGEARAAERKPPASRDAERLRGVTSLRVEQLAAKLTEDTSELALRPADPTVLRALCEAHITAAQQVPASGTLDADATAWRRWVDYCATMGTQAIRGADGRAACHDSEAVDRETILQSGFLIYVASIISPRSKSSAAAKPQSIFNNLLAVRRVHQRVQVDFRILRGATLMLKAQIRAFIRENGPEALLPARKEPLDASQLRRILALKDGQKVGQRTLDWDNFFFVSFKALLCTGLAAAFRKAELCLPDGVDHTLGRLSVASVSWVIRGRAVQQPSPKELTHLQMGDFCVIKPPLCKNDPFGLHFGTKPIWLPVGDDPANAAKAIAAMFLADPIRPEHPEITPLFRVDTSFKPLRHSEADATLKALLTAAFPGTDVSRWSMHSLRIGAACALLAANASPALIQAICRWRSHKSIDIYARLGPADYGRYVRDIERQTVDAITAQRLMETRIDSDSIVAILDGPIVFPHDAE